MLQVPLSRIAMARSGDKGMGPNAGGVKRYEADNLRALNFLLLDSLGGGGSASLRTDAQGKTHGLALLRMELDVPQAVLDATPAPQRN